MLTVIFDPEYGPAVADRRAMDFVKNAIDSRETEIIIGTEAMLYAVRLHILRGLIDPKDVIFQYDGQSIRCNKYAQLESWPTGLADFSEEACLEILNFKVAEKNG